MGADIASLFFAFTLHRFLSGIRNGMLYSPISRLRSISGWALAAPYLVGVLMVVISVLAMQIAFKAGAWSFVPYNLNAFIVGISLSLTNLCTYMALRYNAPNAGGKYEQDLHLWTSLEQGFLSVPLVLCGWPGLIALGLSVYPSVFLQKVAINRFVGESIWDNATDDPTGHTFAIPSLGIKIPRTTQRFRAWMSIGSILLLALVWIFQYDLPF